MKNIYKNKFGLTIVESLIAITISIIIMTSAMILLSSIGGIVGTQKAQIPSLIESNIFLNKLFSFHQKKVLLANNSGALFLSEKSLENGFFTFIGTENYSEVCEAGNIDSEKLKIKNFSPIEGNGGNLFGNGISKIIPTGTSSINPITGNIKISGISDVLPNISKNPSDIIFGGGNFYVSDSLNHSVYKFNSSGILAYTIGMGHFGKSSANDENGNESILFMPTGLAFGNNLLFISDTNNNRILTYNPSDNKVNVFLSEFDGISTPTGLLFDSGNLFIVNNGNQILEFDEDGDFEPGGKEINFSFSEDFEADKFVVELLGTSEIKFLESLSGLANSSDFEIKLNGVAIPNPTNENIIGVYNSVLQYHFARFNNSVATTSVDASFCTPPINSTNYVFEGTNAFKYSLICDLVNNRIEKFGLDSNYFTTFLKSDLINTNNYSFILDDSIVANSVMSSSSPSDDSIYSYKISLWKEDVKVWEKVGRIFSKGKAILKEIKKFDNNVFITGIEKAGPNFILYDSVNRERILYNPSNGNITKIPLSSINLSIFEISENNFISENLLKNISFDENIDIHTNIKNATIKGEFYKGNICDLGELETESEGFYFKF